VSGYDYVLTAAAAHVVLGSAKRLRQEILAELERLAREPFGNPIWKKPGLPAAGMRSACGSESS